MPARKPPPPDEKPHFERFIKTAREIEAGETDEALGQAVEKIAPARCGILKRVAKSATPSNERRASQKTRLYD